MQLNNNNNAKLFSMSISSKEGEMETEYSGVKNISMAGK